jgi:hypothetical protein
MSELIMQKLEDALHPTDVDGIAAMLQIPENSFLKVKFSVPRNVKQLRLYFAMINLVFEHQKEPRSYPTRDRLREGINIALGHFHEVKNPLTGQIFTVPNSISFGAMDNVEFREYFEAFKSFVLDKILPRVQSRDLDQAVADMLRLPGPDQLQR